MNNCPYGPLAISVAMIMAIPISSKTLALKWPLSKIRHDAEIARNGIPTNVLVDIPSAKSGTRNTMAPAYIFASRLPSASGNVHL